MRYGVMVQRKSRNHGVPRRRQPCSQALPVLHLRKPDRELRQQQPQLEQVSSGGDPGGLRFILRVA